jgi:hypothetical protein
MSQEQRVIYNATDISTDTDDFRSGVANFNYATGQYLYVGAALPFNNLWIEMDTVNAIAAVPTIEMWYDGQWTPAVDVIDQTAGLTATGRIQWNTDIDKGWNIEQKSSNVTGLSAFEIYNFYWLRLSWSATMTIGTKIAYIGQKFSTDSILRSFYPDLLLANVLDSYKTGKTNWNEQHFMAAEHIVRDLKKRGIIKARGQLLDYALFADASCNKVAEIVYTAFGIPYADAKKDAREKYDENLNITFYSVDQNADGRLDPEEKRISTNFGTR